MNNIESIKDYFVSMEHYEGSWVIKVKFKNKWVGCSSDDEKIKVIDDEDQPHQGNWWYYAQDTEATVDDMIAFIKATIELNIEVEKKAELMIKKQEEMKELFTHGGYTYDELCTLKFIIEAEKDAKPTVAKKDKKKPAKSQKKAIPSKISEANKVKKEEASVEHAVSEAPHTSSEQQIVEGVAVNATDLTAEEINDLRG